MKTNQAHTEKHISKIFFRITLLAFSLFMLSACGGGSSSDATPSSQQGNTPSSTPASSSSSQTISVSSASSFGDSSSSTSSSVANLSSSISSSNSSDFSISSEATSTASSTPSSTSVSISSAAITNVIAREGFQAVGFAPGTNYDQVFSPSIGQNGKIVFNGNVRTDEAAIYGVWAGSSNDISLIVKTGDSIPGTPDNITFTSGSTAVVTASGDFSMLATLTETRSGGGKGLSTALIAYHNNQLHSVLRVGDLIPVTLEGGLSGSSDIREILGFAMSDSGVVAAVRTGGLPSTAIGNYILVYWNFDSLKLIAISGATLNSYENCSITNDTKFWIEPSNNQNEYFYINNAGEIIFKVNLAGNNGENQDCPSQSILTWKDNNYSVIVDSNFTIPNYPEAIFTNLAPTDINDNGDVTYNSTTKNPSLYDPTDIFSVILEKASERHASWIKRRGSDAKLITKQGDSFYLNSKKANLVGLPTTLTNNQGATLVYSAAQFTEYPGALGLIAYGHAKNELPYANFEEDGIASQLTLLLNDLANLPNIGMIVGLSKYGLGFTNSEDIIIVASSILHLDKNRNLRELFKQYQDVSVGDEVVNINSFSFNSYASGLRNGHPSQISESRSIVFTAQNGFGTNGKNLIIELQY